MRIPLSSVLLAFSLFSLCPSSFAADSETRTITIVSVKGDARNGRTKLKIGDHLKAGELIEVGANSELDIKYSEGHQLRLKAESKIKLADEKNFVRLELLKGKIFMHYQKHAGESEFKIRTRAAVAGVRGTKFQIGEDESKGSYFCVCEGQIGVSRADGTEAQPVKSGQDLWAKNGKKIEPAINSPDMSQMTVQEFDSMRF